MAPIARPAKAPVRRAERVERERDRPDPEDVERRRRQGRERGWSESDRPGEGDEESGSRHIDIRV